MAGNGQDTPPGSLFSCESPAAGQVQRVASEVMGTPSTRRRRGNCQLPRTSRSALAAPGWRQLQHRRWNGGNRLEIGSKLLAAATLRLCHGRAAPLSDCELIVLFLPDRICRAPLSERAQNDVRRRAVLASRMRTIAGKSECVTLTYSISSHRLASGPAAGVFSGVAERARL